MEVGSGATAWTRGKRAPTIESNLLSNAMYPSTHVQTHRRRHRPTHPEPVREGHIFVHLLLLLLLLLLLRRRRLLLLLLLFLLLLLLIRGKYSSRQHTHYAKETKNTDPLKIADGHRSKQLVGPQQKIWSV